MRTIDHLNALRAFEAAARHQSFVGAAAELFVTPAAVGQLVRSLEGALNISLFHRAVAGTARLALTDEGRAALPDVEAGLAHMAAALRTLRGRDATVKVSLPPAFADKWLLPRLHRFHDAHPEIELRLETSGHLVDFKAEGIDIGIRYGGGSWRGMKAEYLMSDEFFPVCSPALMKGRSALRTPADLSRHSLIHDVSMPNEGQFPTWATWLRSVGVDTVDARRGTRINDSAAVLQAAIAGAGVALGRTHLVAADLKAGRLVRPFSEAQATELAYYAVVRASQGATPAVTTFVAWLHEESARDAKQRRSINRR